jgi:hypothetical protein
VSEIADKINQFSREFDDRCFAKHELGEEKYGPGTWLGIDTMEHALDEIVDLGNYVRMTFIKLRMLQEGIAAMQADGSTAAPLPGKEMLGHASIIQTKGIPRT